MSRTMMLLIALGLSIVTGLMLWSYTEEQKKRLLAQYQTVEVVVAARDIPAKTVLTPNDLQTELVPIQFVQPGAVLQVEDAAGKVTLVPFKKGMQILSDAIVDVSALGGLSAVLERGTRAVTIRVDAISGVGGHIQPGDFVDILVLIPSRDPMDQWVTIPFPNVQVLAVGSKLSVPTLQELLQGGRSSSIQTAALAGGASHITVQLPPEKARDLVALSEVGQVVVMLRRFGDIDSLTIDTVRIRQIIRKYIPHPRRVTRKGPKKRLVEVYVGTQKATYEVRGDQVFLVQKAFTGTPPMGGVGGGVFAGHGTGAPMPITGHEDLLKGLQALGSLGGP